MEIGSEVFFAMRAIDALPHRKNSVKLIQLDTPKPAKDELLLRIKQVGVDGTGREINDGPYGDPPAGSDFLILGHEALAEIEGITQTVYIHPALSEVVQRTASNAN